jgi:hypothetical protein
VTGNRTQAVSRARGLRLIPWLAVLRAPSSCSVGRTQPTPWDPDYWLRRYPDPEQA